MTLYEKNGTIVAVNEATGEIISAAKLIPLSVKQVSVLLNDDEAEFIENEFGIDLNEARQLCGTVEDINEILRRLFSIEAEEVLAAGNNSISTYGERAARLVSLIASS